MKASTRDNTKVRKRPDQIGTLVGVRLQPDDLATLDAFIASRPDPKPSRPEVIRQMVRAVMKETK